MKSQNDENLSNDIRSIILSNDESYRKIINLKKIFRYDTPLHIHLEEFMKNISEFEKNELLFKYDIATITDCISIIYRIENTRIKHSNGKPLLNY